MSSGVVPDRQTSKNADVAVLSMSSSSIRESSPNASTTRDSTYTCGVKVQKNKISSPQDNKLCVSL